MGNPIVGWALVLAAFVVGWINWGWKGVLLALTVTVFWLLLSFSRALRAMRVAAGAPIGTTANAVMLNAKLQKGMKLVQILPLAGALGEKRPPTLEAQEAFRWQDAHGDAVTAEFVGGKLARWALERAARHDDAPGPLPTIEGSPRSENNPGR